jgi:hypothetical protein
MTAQGDADGPQRSDAEGTGSGGPGKAAGTGAGTAPFAGAFLPIGITFFLLGLTQGLGEPLGTTFFTVGITFLVLAIALGGAGLAQTKAQGAEKPEPPEETPDTPTD